MVSSDTLTVFVSYARESDEHSEWVKRLADALEQRPDLHVIFDQYELHGGRDLTHFMDRGLASDRIVVVVTPGYVQKAAHRMGGVGYESSVISGELLSNNLADKFVPVLRAGDERPSFLKSKVFIDFRDDQRFRQAVGQLVAALHRTPPARRPEKIAAPPIETAVGQRSERAGEVENRPLVVIRCDVDGERDPMAVPAVENIGVVAATNVKIEDIRVNGARGAGTFAEIDVLRPGERRDVRFDAPDHGLMFRDRFAQYLENDLASRPPIHWENAPTGGVLEPLKMPIFVRYRDPRTGQQYRSEHELEFTFWKHVKIVFRQTKPLAV